MAIYRVINTDIWDDEMVSNFSVEDRYFWLYLLTNPHTTQLGVYHLPLKKACVELGYNADVVTVLLRRFETTYKLIKFNAETSEVAIKNFLKHSILKGGKPVMDCLTKEEKKVKDKELIIWMMDNIDMRIQNEEITNKTVCEFIEYLKEKYPKENINSNSLDNSNLKVINKNINDNDNDNERIVNDSCHDSLHESSDPPKPNKYQWIMDKWNELSVYGVSKIIRLDNSRTGHIKARLKEYSEADILQAIENIKESDFLQGKNNNGWTVSFDFFISATHFPRILEGAYKNRTQPEKQTGVASIVI